MNPFGNDILAGFQISNLFLPAARAATANGTGVDCKDCEGPLTAIAQFGLWTDGTYLVSLEESADNSTFTAITPYEGAFVAVSSAATASLVQTVQFKRTKRYVRGVITETSAGSTGVLFNFLLLGRKKNVG